MIIEAMTDAPMALRYENTQLKDLVDEWIQECKDIWDAHGWEYGLMWKTIDGLEPLDGSLADHAEDGVNAFLRGFDGDPTRDLNFYHWATRLIIEVEGEYEVNALYEPDFIREFISAMQFVYCDAAFDHAERAFMAVC